MDYEFYIEIKHLFYSYKVIHRIFYVLKIIDPLKQEEMLKQNPLPFLARGLFPFTQKKGK